MKFTAPHIEYVELLPIFFLLGGAVLGVLTEAFAPRPRRYGIQVVLALVVVWAALVAAIIQLVDLDGSGPGAIVAEGAFALDGPTLVTWVVVLVLTLMGVLLFAERRLEGGVTAFAGQAAALPGTEAERVASTKGLEHTEVFPLLLFAASGMLMFPAANDLLTLFVALEVLSLPLYLLCGLARRRRLLSQEAALKYFLLGAFSSGFFVYGLALVYGFAGAMDFASIAEAVEGRTGSQGLLIGGMGLMAVGLLFKVGAVPFHNWTPDVYQGAPTAVTGFMAAATKVAAFMALLRLFYVAFGGVRWEWTPMFWVIAILTMAVGAAVALAQTDIKRLLAYSSVAHAGFLLVGFIGVRSLEETGAGEIGSVQAVLFYLLTYGLTTIAAFAIVTLVRDSTGEATALSRWAGLGKRSPLVAGTMAFLLLAMAGIPLTSGFIGKWAIFAAAFGAGAWPLVVIALLLSAVALFLYVKVIVVMYFGDPEGEAAAVTRPSALTSSVIGVGALATLFFGIVPGPLLDFLGRVGVFIR